MSISVPTKYYLRAALFVAELGVRRPINADDVLLLLRNATHQYAYGCLRALLEGAWQFGVKTQAASGGAYEVMYRATGQMGASRDDLHYAVDGEDIAWKVEVWNSSRTVSLGSASGTMTSRAEASGTIALASTGQDVIVEFQGKINGAASEGILYGVRVLEVQVAVANLPG